VLNTKAIIIAAATVLITAGFLFVDWHALLVERKVRFNFSVFK